MDSSDKSNSKNIQSSSHAIASDENEKDSSNVEFSEKTEAKWENLVLNDDLEATMKKHGLNKRNIKTIIHGILKDKTIKNLLKSSLDTCDENNDIDLDIPDLRMTRSRLKSSEEKIGNSSNGNKNMENNNDLPGTITDVTFPDDDDDDQEYQPTLNDSNEVNYENCDVTICANDSNMTANSENIIDKLNAIDQKLKESLTSKKDGHSIVENDLKFCNSLSSDEDLISLRTRSKHSLETVGMDFIEASFNPPDVTGDMYKNQNDDEYWQNWLADLMKDPTTDVNSSSNPDEEDDIEDDPDFNYFEEEDTEKDSEDFRSDPAVQVSKKEFNILMDDASNANDISQPSFSQNIKSSTPTKPNSLNTVIKEKEPNNLPQSLSQYTSQLREFSQLHSLKKQSEFLNKKPFLRKLVRNLKISYATYNKKEVPKFTKRQLEVLQQQMQIHTQLLIQTNLLTRNDDNYTIYMEETFNLLLELDHFKKSGELKCDKSSFDACNLSGALELCKLNIPISSNVDTMPAAMLKKGYKPLSKTLAKTIAYNRTFMYPELLPVSAPAVFPNAPTLPFLLPEDKLIAISMCELSGMLRDFPSLAHEIYLPTRSKNKIKHRIRNVMAGTNASKEKNPIKIYRTSEKLPPPDTSIDFVSSSSCKKPISVKNNHNIPYWLKAMQYEKEMKRLKQQNVERNELLEFNPINNTQSVLLPVSVIPASINTETVPVYVATPMNSIILSNAPQCVPIMLPTVSILNEKVFNQDKIMSQRLQQNVQPVVIPTPSNELASCSGQIMHSCNILNSDTINATNRPKKKEHKTYQPIRPKSDDTVSAVSSSQENVNKPTPVSKNEESSNSENYSFCNKKSEDLNKIIGANLSNSTSENKKNKNFSKSCLNEDNQSMNEKVDLNDIVKLSTDRQSVLEDINTGLQTNNEFQSLSNNNDEHDASVPENVSNDDDNLADIGDNKSVNNLFEEFNKIKTKRKKKKPIKSLKIKLFKNKDGSKISRHRYENDPFELNDGKYLTGESSTYDDIVDSDPDKAVKEAVMAENYIKAVQETLEKHPKKFVSFLEVLNKFSSGVEPAAKLYMKLKDILYDWPDLLQQFVPFLMPAQAIECGLFREYQEYANAQRFLRKLEAEFENNQTHLIKIFDALNEMSHSASVTETDLKKNVMALLKDKPLLQKDFVKFFEHKEMLDDLGDEGFEEIDFDEVMSQDQESISTFEFVSIDVPSFTEESKQVPIRDVQKKPCKKMEVSLIPSARPKTPEPELEEDIENPSITEEDDNESEVEEISNDDDEEEEDLETMLLDYEQDNGEGGFIKSDDEDDKVTDADKFDPINDSENSDMEDIIAVDSCSESELDKDEEQTNEEDDNVDFFDSCNSEIVGNIAGEDNDVKSPENDLTFCSKKNNFENINNEIEND